MNAATLLKLGRVSNLPTVWSNVVCGAVLGGAPLGVAPVAISALSGTLFYVGGMLLNDAFDAEIDARERPERPIPSGRVTRKEVFTWGFGMLGAGLVLLALAALFSVLVSAWAILAGVVTALAVVAYNRWHKGYAWSPIVMGICRAGLYVMAALAAAGTPTRDVSVGALLLLAYIVGLTHVARFENVSVVGRVWPSLFVLAPLVFTLPVLFESLALIPFWLVTLGWTLRALYVGLRGGRGKIGVAVVSLIAGISLVDATFMAARGAHTLAIAGIVAFGFTLLLQTWVRGT